MDLRKVQVALRNARISLVAFGGDITGLPESMAREIGADMIQYHVLTGIDEALAELRKGEIK